METIELTQERRELGYEYSNIKYLRKLTGGIEEQIDLVREANWAIINVLSTDPRVIRARLETGKLTFLISERVLKRGALKLLDPRFWELVRICSESRNQKVFLLCMGGFVAKDYEFMGFHQNHSFKFGYFPETSHISLEEQIHDQLKILWVGRMIDWKRPSFAVRVVQEVGKNGVPAKLTMIGDGEKRKKVEGQIRHNHLDNIELLGIQSNEVVQKQMCQADALLITSTRREGWGAVINEALSLGTPVVSCKMIGAAPYLISEGVNGFLYSTYNIAQAATAIEKVAAADRKQMRINAKNTIALWNAKTAAERFLSVVEVINQNQEPFIYKDGPMSKG